MKRLVPVFLIAACLVQLAVPAWMIVRRETALREGGVFRFATRPVDPYDAFRGRYVALNFDLSVYSNHTAVAFQRGQRLYAALGTSEAGFARIDALTAERPGTPAIPVRVAWSHNGTVTLRLPMDRFYLEETRAPEAERLYRQHSRRGATNTYAVVRVFKTFPVIEDLVIDGRSVYAYFDESAPPPENGGATTAP